MHKQTLPICILTVVSLFSPLRVAYGMVSGMQNAGDKIITAAELLAALGELQGEMQMLQAQFAQQADTLAAARRRTTYGEYLRVFSRLRDRIENFQLRLGEYYRQVDRLYRVSPNGSEYRQARKAYVENKAMFDSLDARFRAIEPPEKIRYEAVTSPDTRLNQKIANASRNLSQPTAEKASDLEQSDRSQFIGTFDAVEMFLVVKGGSACYLFFGWKENLAPESGRSVEKVHISVARSEFFPTSTIEHASPNAHLERALSLNVVPLDAQGVDLQAINEYLARIKSYAR